jgi:hypothetical protein
MTTSGGPALSVSVIMFTSRPALVRCLDALDRQQNTPDFEILVACDDALTDVGALRQRFPRVTFLPLGGTRTPAELRSVAATKTSGRIVAFLEDHCIPDVDWCARVIAAHEQSHAAIGGAVEKGFAPGRSTDGALNWAVYLTDYSRYMNPMPEGPAHALTDCNVTYKRAVLEKMPEAWAGEFHENVVHEHLCAAGHTLWFDPRIVVREYRPLSVPDVVRDRYAFGRLFASTRVADATWVRRLVLAAASLLMPPVLSLRAARNLSARGRHREQIVRCLPALLFVTAVWMFGEMVGYLTGSPGSLRPRTVAGPVADVAAAGVRSTRS